MRAGDKLRVNVQLFRVADDVPIWSGRYDRALKDIFEVQDEISRSIVNELRLNLGCGQRRYNTNLEAYDLYLKAKSLVNRTPGYDAEEIAQSIPLFQAAIAPEVSTTSMNYFEASPSRNNLLYESFSVHASGPKPISHGAFHPALSSTSDK